ncbi:MAG: class I SAM-dependent methyltransferase [Deltaproteobacteria bacterium]|nr:class I SAM-dependent methyltransferase [Deltaproteobacteria bacterium]
MQTQRYDHMQFADLAIKNNKLFSVPEIYDLAFSYDIRAEISNFQGLFADCLSKHILLPACGTGRYALGLAEKEHKVKAFDIAPEMIRWAKSKRKHKNIDYFVADMTIPYNVQNDSFDAVFLLNNSFRYILNKEHVIQSLKISNKALKPHGFYFIEVGLNEKQNAVGSVTQWQINHGTKKAYIRWVLKNISENIATDLVKITIESTKHSVVFEEEQLQRIWGFDEICLIFEKTGFKIKSIFDKNFKQIAVDDFNKIYQQGKYFLIFIKKQKP